MQQDNYNQRVEIELIKRDILMITKLCEKFDITIDKLQQVASDLSRVMSLQEQKMSSQDKINIEFENLSFNQMKEHKEDIKALQSKLENFEVLIQTELKKVNGDLLEKINSIEKWRYGVMAVIAVGVFLLDNILEALKIF